MSAVPCCGGIEVAQAQWDRAVRPSGERWAVPHDAGGVVTLVEQVQALHPTLMVLEATGGLERAATAALAPVGLPVVVVTPRQARACARATGPLATTEAWEARARAPGADGIRPPPRPRPAAPTQDLRALVGRRQPLLVMRTAAQHRVAGTSARRAKEIPAPLPWLHARIATLDDALATRLRASPRWREHDDRVPRAPGRGPVCARTLLRALPALGTLHRHQSAAWVGVAPRHGDRGTWRGRRMSWGGRAHVRTVLDRGPLVATRDTPQRTAFYERLRAAGKGKKVALTACMPKLLTILNAMLKHRTPWQTQEVQD